MEKPKTLSQEMAVEGMMNNSQEKLSKRYALAAERMSSMGISGNVELVWKKDTLSPEAERQSGGQERPVLVGVINGNTVQLQGPAASKIGFSKGQIKMIPGAVQMGDSYSGKINGIELDIKTAKEMFGMLMGVAIEKEEKDKAMTELAKENADFLVKQILGKKTLRQPFLSYPEAK